MKDLDCLETVYAWTYVLYSSIVSYISTAAFCVCVSKVHGWLDEGAKWVVGGRIIVFKIRRIKVLTESELEGIRYKRTSV